MGLGDVKLVGPLTLLMGWPRVLIGLFLSFSIGAVIGLTMVALKKRTFRQSIPFGPFLVIGTALSLLVGEKLLQWYLGFLY